MKRQWERPEMYYETYELTQSVAAGCKTVITVIPGGDTLVDVGCKQQNGGGHWHFTGTYAELLEKGDQNHDGRLSWDEFKYACETASNNVVTGDGHKNHNQRIQIGDTVIEGGTPFNS